jgi:very-short-patch-repair endonuclease
MMARKKRIRSSQAIQQRARELRKEPTTSEALLWARLRNRQLDGLKFRRQHPIGRSIVDFYCPEKRLVIEVDGGIHDQTVEEDLERTKVLQSLGYRVIRFRNLVVEQNINLVLSTIQKACRQDE